MLSTLSYGQQCTDLTQNFCLIDKSAKYRVFCESDSGHTYEGSLNCKGQRDGTGVYTWPSGQRYEGGFRNDKYHGQGIFTYASGEIYKGQWRLNDEHGRGETISADRKWTRKQTWKSGKRHGPAIHIHISNQVNRGSYKNGKKDGVWIIDMPDNRIIEVIYKNGVEISRKETKTIADVNREKRAAEAEQRRQIRERAERQRIAEQARVQREAEEKARQLEIDRCRVETGGDSHFCRRISGKSEFFVSCMLDKALGADRDLVVSAENVCTAIERSPSTIEKLKYGSGVMKFLK